MTLDFGVPIGMRRKKCIPHVEESMQSTASTALGVQCKLWPVLNKQLHGMMLLEAQRIVQGRSSLYRKHCVRMLALPVNLSCNTPK